MGERLYALEMAKLLDPENIYFNSRIVSRDDSKRMFEKSLDVVLGKENAIVILDDKESVWSKKHQENLIVVERYHFVPTSTKQFSVGRKSHSQLRNDESESEGALVTSLEILRQIHSLFFHLVLKSVRKEVLKGCRVVFISGKISTYSLRLRKMAEELGAEWCDEIEACVTHVVSIDLRNDKSIWPANEKKLLVNPNWIEASNHMCRGPKVARRKFPRLSTDREFSSLIFLVFRDP